MTEEQKQAVLDVDLNRAIALGGNIYFLAKLGRHPWPKFPADGWQHDRHDRRRYRNMMIGGGRSVEGNRVIGENGDAQAHHQPHGQAGKTLKA